MATRLFSDTELAAIEARIAEVEAHTAGEVVVAIKRRCDDYASRRAPTVALLALGTAYLSSLLVPFETYQLLWLLSALLVVGWWLSGLAGALRLLVPRAARANRCLELAFQIFAERGVHRTRDRSGLLILIAEAEHEVVILGDEGIHARVAVEGWQVQVDGIVAALREGRALEGVQTALTQLGATLAEHFPPRADDTNELSNAPVT